MNDAEFQKLMEMSWRRSLTAAEEAALNAYLASHPAEQVRWEGEAGLSQLLGQLPEVPVPSNFTSQILQIVERDAASVSVRERRVIRWLRFNWLPRIAFTVLLICAGFISIQQYKRTQVAQDVRTVSNVAAVPPLWLEDFEAINRLSQPPVDTELLAALE